MRRAVIFMIRCCLYVNVSFDRNKNFIQVKHIVRWYEMKFASLMKYRNININMFNVIELKARNNRNPSDLFSNSIHTLQLSNFFIIFTLILTIHILGFELLANCQLHKGWVRTSRSRDHNQYLLVHKVQTSIGFQTVEIKRKIF